MKVKNFSNIIINLIFRQKPSQNKVKFEWALQITEDWCDRNGLTLNSDKCEFMCFSPNNVLKPTDIRFKNQPVRFASSVRYLGLIIDDKLDWKEHLKEIRKKILAYIAMLRRFTGKLFGFNLNLLKRLYTTVICPKIFYGSPIWCHMTKCTYFKSGLDVTHNLALRALIGTFRNTPARALEAAFGLDPISESLRTITTLDILRMHTKGQWDIYMESEHYAANKMLKIKKIITEGYDAMPTTTNTTSATSIVPDRIDWLETDMNMLNVARTKSIELHSDASVDKEKSRTGISIYCKDIDLSYSLATKVIMSSYKAELFGVDKSLFLLLELDLSDTMITIFVDNLEVEQSPGAHIAAR